MTKLTFAWGKEKSPSNREVFITKGTFPLHILPPWDRWSFSPVTFTLWCHTSEYVTLFAKSLCKCNWGHYSADFKIGRVPWIIQVGPM